MRPRRRCLSVALLVGGLASVLVLLSATQLAVMLLMGSGFTLNTLSNDQLLDTIQRDTKGEDPFGIRGNHLSNDVHRSNVNKLNLSDTTNSAKNSAENHPESFCHHIDPKALFFIRIPKCASTSFVDLLKKIGRSRFELLFDPSGAFDWDNSTSAKVAAIVTQRIQHTKRLVYARHFYHVDFKPYGLTNYSYITIIREPISRFISSYLYYHFSSKKYIQLMLKPSHKNETLPQCIKHQHNGCASNWMTKYFCGNDPFCKRGDDTALETAKQNLRQEFIAVGILEEIELSLSVFRSVLPEYFTRLNPKTEAMKSLNKNDKTMQLTTEVLTAITEANAADIQLYSFAKELLHKKARECFIT